MEGPGVKVISERLKVLEKKIIKEVKGNTKKFNIHLLKNRKILKVFHYGKNLLFKIEKLGYLRIHFLMYGSYSINKQIKNERALRLMIDTGNYKIYFYNSIVEILERFNFKAQDILSSNFSIKKAINILKSYKGYICDALLEQEMFPGIGNIIKVEALYRTKIHPLSTAERIPEDKLKTLIKEARNFSFLFYDIRKGGKLLRDYTWCYGKKKCLYCQDKIIRRITGNKRRFSYYCPNCQVLY